MIKETGTEKRLGVLRFLLNIISGIPEAVI